MTRNLWWITLAAALTALTGAAWAEAPHKDTAGANCCAAKGCCTAAAATTPCCAKEANGTCCAGCGTQSVTAKDGACCACCAKGCTCCTKEASGCCGKDAASAKGCACCAKATASRAAQKKRVIVYVVTAPAMPGPLPVPTVCLPPPQPMPPAGPAIFVQGNDNVRQNQILRQAPLYPGQALVVPAPVAPEPLPPPAPIVSNPPVGPVEAQLTGSAPMPLPPPPAVSPRTPPDTPATIRCRLEAATEDGATRLKVWSGPSTCVTCDHLDLKVAGFGGIKVAVADGQVRLHTPSADGRADRIVVSVQEDQLILEGNVRLQYHLNEAEHADVSASRVVVYLADGRVEIQPARSEQRPAALQPPPPAPPVFNFFTGFIR